VASRSPAPPARPPSLLWRVYKRMQGGKATLCQPPTDHALATLCPALAFHVLLQRALFLPLLLDHLLSTSRLPSPSASSGRSVWATSTAATSASKRSRWSLPPAGRRRGRREAPARLEEHPQHCPTARNRRRRRKPRSRGSVRQCPHRLAYIFATPQLFHA